MTSEPKAPRRDRAALVRLLDQGRGVGLLAMVVLLLAIFGVLWRDGLVLSVTGRDAQAEILSRGVVTEQGRLVRSSGQAGMASTAFLVTFRIHEADGAPVTFQRSVGVATLNAAQPGAVLPARQSALWPDRFATLEPSRAGLQAAGWLGLAALALLGLGWRRWSLAREADRGLVAMSQGTPVGGRIVSHRRRKGGIALAWRSEDGLSGTTLPMPDKGVARRWPVTGPITLWRHPDGKGRVWSEAERGG